MAALPWISYLQRMVGRGHPTLADTLNTPLRTVLSQSGYNPDATTFTGLPGPVFNVKAFGAKGDGVTDDGPAIQMAIDTCFAAGGGAVFIPGQTFALATVTNFNLLTWRPGVTIIGVGRASVLKAKDNVVVHGAGGSGIRILWNSTETLTSGAIIDLVIDLNGANNLPSAQDIIDGRAAAFSRTGGDQGGSVYFSRVTFKNCPASQFIFLPQSGATPWRNIHITDCHFEECGTSVPGATITDHSSIYMDAIGFVIANNTFYNSTADTVAAAIETHGPGVVVGNTVENYRSGSNVGGDVRDVAGLIFDANNIINAIAGVRLYTAGAFVLSDVKITGNTFLIREAPAGAASFGVEASSSTMTSSANGSGLTITGNTFRQLTQSGLTVLSNGVFLLAWDDILIDDNTVSNFVAEGILVQAQTGVRKLTRIKISNNKIRGCGITSTANRKRLVAVNAGTTVGVDDINFLDFTDNQLICDAPAGTIASWCLQVSGRFPNAYVDANDFKGFALAPVAGFTNGVADIVVIHGTGAFNPTQTLVAAGGSTWYDPSTGKRYFNRIVAGTDSFGWLMEDWGSAAPATTLHQQGSRRINSSAAVGQPKAWLCTVNGTPGTWVSEGNL